jgi:nitrogen fixation/metabolism regulation signal transduction histidine kinase
MGLAMVHRIVSDHGGTLELKPRDSGGAIALLALPAALAPPRPLDP